MKNISFLSVINPQIEEDIRVIIREEFTTALTEFFSKHFPKSLASETEQTFSIPELAAYLHVSLGTIHAYKKRKVFPYYQTGRTIYFKKSEVDAALAVGNKKIRL